MTPPQEEEEAFTYQTPAEKKDYLDAITLNLAIEIDSDDGNINGDQMRQILAAILKRYSTDNPQDIRSMNKPSMAKEIARVLGFESSNKHVGKKNGVVSEGFYKDVWEVLRPTEVELSLETWDDQGEYDAISRNEPKVVTAKDLLDRMVSGDIRIPQYQRANTMWTAEKKQNLVDSMLRHIPMPTIVIGKIEGEETWHLVDGQQRLENLWAFVADVYPWNATSGVNNVFTNLPVWMQDRIYTYNFVLEQVVCPNVESLAHIYSRYNTSGKALSEAQVRIAFFHHRSMLHHCLLSMAGGPIPDIDDYDPSEKIEFLARYAKTIRRMLPKIGMPTDEERIRIKQPTEKTYDLLCRLAGYTLYDATTVEGGVSQPTAKMAVRQVLGRYNGNVIPENLCYSIAVQIYQTMEKVDRIFGEIAWRKYKPILNPDDPNLVTYVDGPLNGWASQVQYAGVWEFKDKERLMVNNREELHEQWLNHYKKNHENVRQNSKSLWDSQEKWIKKLGKLIKEWAVDDLNHPDSERGKRLRENAELLVQLRNNDQAREALDSNYEKTLLKYEYQFMKLQEKEMIQWQENNQ